VPPLLAALLLCCARPALPAPEPPEGPDTLHHGQTGTWLLYNHPDQVSRIRYAVNWGDQTAETTPALRLGDTVTVRHAWPDTGDFALRCRAVADADPRTASDWTDPATVTVINAPPETPGAVLGPDTAYADTAVEFSAATTDPEADLIDYLFDWGDGSSSTAGGYASGDTCRVLYQWNAAGDYAVRVRARDALGSISGWSPVRFVTLLP
jgi:hypothetical protein